MEQDTVITLTVERLIGTFGRVTVQWVANGSATDIFPTSGVVCLLTNTLFARNVSSYNYYNVLITSIWMIYFYLHWGSICLTCNALHHFIYFIMLGASRDVCWIPLGSWQHVPCWVQKRNGPNSTFFVYSVVCLRGRTGISHSSY